MQALNNDRPESANENIAMENNSGAICPFVDSNTGDVCGEKTGLQILHEFRELYEQRIQSIDPNSDTGAQEKIDIMMEWIKDLDAQNTMLVSTVEELEEVACCRVKILEEKLKHTSTALTNNMLQYAKPSEAVIGDLHNRIAKLEMNEENLKGTIMNLQCDIRGLLELIRRAGRENSWRLDGIRFFEIDPSDIPIPDESIYGQATGDNKNIDNLTKQLQLLNENEKKSIEYQDELQQKVTYLSEKLQNREEKIEKLMCKFEELQDSFNRETEPNADNKNDTTQIIHLLDMEKSDLIAVESSDEDIQEESVNADNVKVCQLQNELEEKIEEIARLTQHFNQLEKESLESREALALEVAEKHDIAMNFKRRMIILENVGWQLTKQLHFKEEIIREMRKERQLLETKAGFVSSKSPKTGHVNATPTSQQVTWGDGALDETSGQIKTHSDVLLTTLPEVKAVFIDDLRILKEKIDELHQIWYRTTLMEKATCEKYLTVGESKANDILAMLEKHKSRNIENSDDEKSTSNESFHCTDKLMSVIDTLSDLCIDKHKRILDIEFVLQDIYERNGQIGDSSANEMKTRQNPDITRHQFSAMEEFRVCTVEAQAATEDLREEIDTLMCNLNCRHQYFIDLFKSIQKMQDAIYKPKQHMWTVIKKVDEHVKKEIVAKATIKLKHEQLKDIKNEINEARSKFSLSVNYTEHESNIYNRLFDQIVDVVESVVCNLQVFLIEDIYGLELLKELSEDVKDIEESLKEIQRVADRVLEENKIAQDDVDDKTVRLDKLKQELDYAHTKMQDQLENIVFINEQNESNGHSSSTDDTLSMDKSDENSQQCVVEVNKLKNSLLSKDKLIEHKDEIIRIQKDSMEMTQGEYKNLRQRLQSKIEAQDTAINQYVEEKMKLIEQNRLQNQTIKHLQDAVVEAKKNLNRQLPQKSTVNSAVADGWSATTPSVFNNGHVHDEYINGHESDIQNTIKYILRKNNELELQLIAYRQDLFTMMKVEKRRAQSQGLHNCKVYTCFQEMNELKDKLKEYEKRLYINQILLKEKSDELAVLEANFQMINNECSILKEENKSYEMQQKNNSSALEYKLKELQRELCIVSDNYHRVCLDYKKSQKQLMETATREIELQRSLSEALENSMKDETNNHVNDLTNNLNLELEDATAELNEKEYALVHTQDICKSYVEQIKFLTHQIKLLGARNTKLSDMNEYLMQQLQDFQRMNHYLSNNVEKDTMKFKKSSSQIVMLSRKKMHGDGLLLRPWRKINDRCKKHSHQRSRPFASNITLSTCCSIRTFTMTTPNSMNDNSL